MLAHTNILFGSKNFRMMGKGVRTTPNEFLNSMLLILRKKFGYCSVVYIPDKNHSAYGTYQFNYGIKDGISGKTQLTELELQYFQMKQEVPPSIINLIK